MATIRKFELVRRIADLTQVQQVDVGRVVQCFLDELGDELVRGNRMEFRGFGVFSTVTRIPWVCRNFQTGGKIAVSARRFARFKVVGSLKERIRNGR